MRQRLLARFREILEAESILAEVEFSKAGNMAGVNEKPPKIQVCDYLVEGIDYPLAMFLHELAHLIRSREMPELGPGDKHDGKFADEFTWLVSEYMTDKARLSSRHPSKPDTCKELVEMLKGWRSHSPYKDVGGKWWFQFDAILSEFSKGEDGKEGR